MNNRRFVKCIKNDLVDGDYFTIGDRYKVYIDPAGDSYIIDDAGDDWSLSEFDKNGYFKHNEVKFKEEK